MTDLAFNLIMDCGQALLANGGEVFRAQDTMEIMAQVGGNHRNMPHSADRSVLGGSKNAVGQHINVKFPQVEAARHDLHGLLHPEHLRAVFQQGLPCGHDKIGYHLLQGEQAMNSRDPFPDEELRRRIQGCIKKTGAAKGRKQYSYQKTSLGVLTNAADGFIIVSISQKWL